MFCSPSPSSAALPIVQGAADTFEKRAALFLEHAADSAGGWLDESGRWTASSAPLIARERFWLSLALYSCGKARLADAVIRSSSLDKGEFSMPSQFDIFHTNISIVLLSLHRGKMAGDVQMCLETLVRGGFSLLPGNRSPDFQFHGYNDNMPAKASMGLIIGGEMFGNAEAVDHGLWNLRQFASQLSRRGINSEFNSPTYTPLTLHAMAEISRRAQHEEARVLAGQIEARLWIDIASRFHPEMGVVAGPHSRAYTVDTLHHVTLLSSLLWFVLGETARPSPMELFSEAPGLVLHYKGNRPFNIAQMCWLAAGDYQLPEVAQRLLQRKIYPARSVATVEMGDFGPDFPAGPTRIESFLTKDFTLGTASAAFLNGEPATPYFVTYKRRPEVRSYRDIGSVFSKFVINDEEPGTLEIQHPDYTNSDENGLLKSHCKTTALQSDGTAIVLTQPHLSPGGLIDDEGGKSTTCSRLSELIIFPAHHGGCDEILVGGRSRADWSGAVSQGEWIACRRGQLLIAIRPLVYTWALGEPRIRLEKINKYEVIRTDFHQGEPRAFTRTDLRHIFGGFLAEHASADDFDSLEDFARTFEPAKFTDYFWTTRRVRYRRPSVEMEISWSPGSLIPRFATINRQLVEWPALKIDGVGLESIPLLGQDLPSIPDHFPWTELRCAQADWPSAIGDRDDD